MSELYKRIEELAKNNGLTVNALRLKAGVSQTTLSELKSGRTQDLSRKTAQKLADVLGITVDELYGVSAVSEVEEMQDELFEQRKILFDLSKKATKEELDTFIKMMKAITDE